MRPAECGHFAYTDADTPRLAKLGFGVPALELASMGYAVLPLKRAAKSPHPMLGERGGVHHATFDPEQVMTWWKMDRWANIGVATGSPSRLVVIDLDTKHGKNGVEELRRMLYSDPSARLDIPQGCWARTPSGGIHVWMRPPAAVRVPDRPGILPGVDVKGDGGYVLAAPSVLETWPEARPGAPRPSAGALISYRWEECPCGAPQTPDWVPQWLFWRNPSADGASQPDHGVSDLERLKERGAEPGSRNTTFYVLACRLYRIHPEWSPEQVMAELREVYDATDTFGFPWSEVELAAWSARQFIQGENEKWARDLGSIYDRWGRWTPS